MNASLPAGISEPIRRPGYHGEAADIDTSTMTFAGRTVDAPFRRGATKRPLFFLWVDIGGPNGVLSLALTAAAGRGREELARGLIGFTQPAHSDTVSDLLGCRPDNRHGSWHSQIEGFALLPCRS